MLAPLAPVIIPRILRRDARRQVAIGWQLRLKKPPRGWIGGLMVANMTKTWRAYGLPIHGFNYFTLGDIKDGLSARYRPDERLYQAWLGGYVFTFDEAAAARKPLDYIRLCAADQKKWLWYYGVPAPKMDFGTPKFVENISISGVRGKLYWWSGATQSDVGRHSGRLYNRAIMDGMAAMMNRLNPGLSLKGVQFIPKRTDPAYTELAIHGYIAIMDIATTTKALLYVCMKDNTAASRRDMKKLITTSLEILPFAD